MNAMIGENLSIITSKAQTTRHRIMGIVNGEDLQVVYSDTPGLIRPGYKLQEYMLKFARSAFTDADIILYVTDVEDGTQTAEEMIEQLNNIKIPLLILINKIDLKQKIEPEQIASRFKQLVRISAKKQRNIDLLEEAIARFIFNGKIKSGEEIWISNLRHIEKLKKIQKSLMRIRKLLEKNLPLELIAEELRESVGSLDEILGRRFSQDLLDTIFSEFCIGK